MVLVPQIEIACVLGVANRFLQHAAMVVLTTFVLLQTIPNTPFHHKLEWCIGDRIERRTACYRVQIAKSLCHNKPESDVEDRLDDSTTPTVGRRSKNATIHLDAERTLHNA